MKPSFAIALGLAAGLAVPEAAPLAADAMDAFIQRDRGPIPEPQPDTPPVPIPETLPGFEFPIEVLDRRRDASPPGEPDPARSMRDDRADAPMTPSPVMGGMFMGMPTIGVLLVPMMGTPMMQPIMPPAGLPLTSGGRDLALDADDVRGHIERQLAWWGNPRLRVGAVEVRDEDVIVAEIVTREGALVDRFRVDRRTGWTMRIE